MHFGLLSTIVYLDAYQRDATTQSTQGGLCKFSHACMHGRMDACMHGCMHGCMHAWMNACMDAWMHACMDVCLHAWMHGCMRAWMHGCMHGCMDVCIHACMYAAMHASMHFSVPDDPTTYTTPLHNPSGPTQPHLHNPTYTRQSRYLFR